jgi:NADH-quinone oxidoreductase subunit N
MDAGSVLNARALLGDLRWVTPEIILTGFLLLTVLADLTRMRKGAVGALALVGILSAGLACAAYLRAYPEAPAFFWGARETRLELTAFGNAYRIDAFSYAFKLLALGAAFLVGLFSLPVVRDWPSGRGEFFALLLACTLGLLLMASANDLLMMYLALEFVSVTSYVLAGLQRRSRRGAEASLKYIIYGAGASGMMIYGMSFLYGLTGTLEVSEIGRRLAEVHAPPTLALVTSVLVMAGFGYKIAAVPFHMWCPDVYEGAPTPVTAFFSVGPKAAGFAMLARFLEGVFPSEPGPFEWKLVMALLAVLTMAVGNFGALHQQNFKRLLAYSSIAHAGYILIAFTAFTPEATSAVFLYLALYAVMNLGAFLAVLILERRFGAETVESCRGLGWRAPVLGALLTVFLVALTGLPPTAGFTAKLLLFGSVIEHSLGADRTLGIVLVVAGALFSVISLFYYMRIVAALYLARPREEAAAGERPDALSSAVLGLLGAGTILFGLAWDPIQKFAVWAGQTLYR